MTLKLICAGAQKAGTAWLFHQMRSNPDVWTPPFKEVRYLQDTSYGRGLSEAAQKLNSRLHNAVKSGSADTLDLRDLNFLRRYLYEGEKRKERPFASYAQLFGNDNSEYGIDISPQYATMPYQMVASVARQLPKARAMLLIREPVARFWSYYSMMIRTGLYTEEECTDPQKVEASLRKVRVIATGEQSYCILRWQKAFGDRYRTFLMDDMIATPEEFRQQVFDFAGLDHTKCTLPANHNAKSDYKKYELTDDVRAMLKAHFREETERVVSIVGGGTEAWLD